MGPVDFVDSVIDVLDHRLVARQGEPDASHGPDGLERFEVMAQSLVGPQRLGPELGDGPRQDVVAAEQQVVGQEADVAWRMAGRVQNAEAVDLLAFQGPHFGRDGGQLVGHQPMMGQQVAAGRLGHAGPPKEPHGRVAGQGDRLAMVGDQAAVERVDRRLRPWVSG